MTEQYPAEIYPAENFRPRTPSFYTKGDSLAQPRRARSIESMRDLVAEVFTPILQTTADQGEEIDGIAGKVVGFIYEQTGIDLSILFDTVGGWIDGAISTTKRIVDDLLGILTGAIVIPINSLVQGVKDWFYGVFQPGFGGVLESLQSRTQILEGVVGYGSWVATDNLFIGLDQDGVGKRVMQFDHQVGPALGVGLVPDTPLASKKVQRLMSRGLWQVIAQTRARDTNYTGNHKVRMDVVVKAPDGAEHYRRSMDAVAVAPPTIGLGGDGQVTLQANVMFVVPDPYYRVYVELFSGKWRWFYGGSQWSGITILKHSSEVENTGVVNPGEPPIEG